MNPLKLVPIGKTGISVTNLGLGGAALSGMSLSGNLFGGVAKDDALSTIVKAFEAGVAYFDTAPLYGSGESEYRMGKALSGKPRTSFVISTKVGRLLIKGSTDSLNIRSSLSPVFDMTREGILRSLDESLKRLGMDSVEIVYLHDPDVGNLEKEACDSAIPAMLELREQGAVKAIGLGMNQWEMAARMVRRFNLDIVLLAGRYTLLEQGALKEFMPLCLERGISVVIGGPYNSGILSRDLSGPVSYNYDYAPMSLVTRAKKLRDICAKHGTPLKAAALQFAMAHPAVVSVIPGAQSPTEVIENIEMSSFNIPTALWEELKDENLLLKGAPTPSV